MRLVLDPAQDAAHGEWLRQTPGAYEWWYFDAVSEDGLWSLACIWFLGNPFSPYYRLSTRRAGADPYAHNALFFALHHQGRLHAYHFTRFPRELVCADEARPAALRFGPNDLSYAQDTYRLRLADENGNRRHMTADLQFQAAPLATQAVLGPERTDETHFWLPAAPSCQVTAAITLSEPRNIGVERIGFQGHGYHDHNWGTLPFASEIKDWYWARASFPQDRAAILYHVDRYDKQGAASHMLLFERGQLRSHDPHAEVTRGQWRVNVFGTRYATMLAAKSGDMEALFPLGKLLDSSPFYIRALSRPTLVQAGRTETGSGIAEYFRPRLLGTRLAASAMKARIVEA